jgi:hypothetical protein
MTVSCFSVANRARRLRRDYSVPFRQRHKDFRRERGGFAQTSKIPDVQNVGFNWHAPSSARTGSVFPLQAKEVSMQLLALLSSFPPAPVRHDQNRCSPLPLAAQFTAALTIIAVVVIGLEIASRDYEQAANGIASLEQEF